MAASAVRLADRALVRVAGPGAIEFLQGLMTADVPQLREPHRPLLAAGILSAKGRLLLDCILHRDGESEILVDLHKDLSDNLLRLLRRHRLRQPLEIDVDDTRLVVASPEACEGLHPDPRYAGLGCRGIADASSALTFGEDAAWYLQRRVVHSVPEGPGDLGVDTAFPLHANLDLFGAVSFSKGCYLGQELTTRSRFRGAVRRRFLTLIAGPEPGPGPLEPSAAADPARTALPCGVPATAGAEASNAEVEAQVFAQDVSEPLGTLRSVSGAAGLCQIKLPEAANTSEAFSAAVSALPPLFVAGGVRVYPVLPPYCE